MYLHTLVNSQGWAPWGHQLSCPFQSLVQCLNVYFNWKQDSFKKNNMTFTEQLQRLRSKFSQTLSPISCCWHRPLVRSLSHNQRTNIYSLLKTIAYTLFSIAWFCLLLFHCFTIPGYHTASTQHVSLGSSWWWLFARSFLLLKTGHFEAQSRCVINYPAVEICLICFLRKV